MTTGQLLEVAYQNVRDMQMGEADGTAPGVAEDLGYTLLEDTAEVVAAGHKLWWQEACTLGLAAVIEARKMFPDTDEQDREAA